MTEPSTPPNDIEDMMLIGSYARTTTTWTAGQPVSTPGEPSVISCAPRKTVDRRESLPPIFSDSATAN
ncbi:hypothetical protein [Nocardia aurea]|uniref:hypothetical protein n=1 Tax=Nocardia aurea TaxID=2144174 RepID=UPI0033A39253